MCKTIISFASSEADDASAAKMTVAALKAKICEMSKDEAISSKMRSMKKAELISLHNKLMNDLSGNAKINMFLVKRQGCGDLPPAKKRAV